MSLGVYEKGSDGRMYWGRKTHPECARHQHMGWDIRLNNQGNGDLRVSVHLSLLCVFRCSMTSCLKLWLPFSFWHDVLHHSSKMTPSSFLKQLLYAIFLQQWEKELIKNTNFNDIKVQLMIDSVIYSSGVSPTMSFPTSHTYSLLVFLSSFCRSTGGFN